MPDYPKWWQRKYKNFRKYLFTVTQSYRYLSTIK